MSNYTSNFEALLTGHLGLPITPATEGGKVTANTSTYIPQGRTSIDDNLDIRDTLAYIVANGYTDFSNKDVQTYYGHLAHLIGPSRAERLFVQAFSFNQKPGNNKKGGEEKIQQFYDTGSDDPETNKTMLTIKNIGFGVQEGYRTSINEGVRMSRGLDTPSGKDKNSKDTATIQDIVNKKTGQ